MSANLTQAVADARQAEANSAQIAQILAVVQAVNAATPAAPAHAACSCSHEKAGGRSAGKTAAWIAGGAACACVLTGLFLAIALTAIAVTVGGCVSYLLIREIRKGK
jgi:ferric-dicitrate binding protein FerR (iron transport regulator)